LGHIDSWDNLSRDFSAYDSYLPQNQVQADNKQEMERVDKQF